MLDLSNFLKPASSTLMDDLLLVEEQDELVDITKSDRLRNCSTVYGVKIRAQNGNFVRTVYRCGLVRECPICRRLKAERLEREICAVESQVRVLTCGEEEAKELCKMVGTANYRRFPREGGDYTVVFAVQDGVEDVGDSYCDADIDFYALCVAPEGKRITGKLGKKPVSGGDKVKVKNFIAPDLTHDDWRRMAKAAFEATKVAKTRNLIELQIMVEKRQDALEYQLQLAGVKYWYTVENQKVELGRVKWDEWFSLSVEEE